MTLLLVVSLLQPVGPPVDCLTSHKMGIGDLARCSGLLVPYAEAAADGKICDARVATAMAIADDRTKTCGVMIGLLEAAKAARDEIVEATRTEIVLNAAEPVVEASTIWPWVAAGAGAVGGFFLARWIYKDDRD
mgnify:CR=1 FL=1